MKGLWKVWGFGDLLYPNCYTFVGLVVLFGYEYHRRYRAAAAVSVVAPARRWFRSAKDAMALSGRNPEANVDSVEPATARDALDRIRRPHDVYDEAIEARSGRGRPCCEVARGLRGTS